MTGPDLVLQPFAQVFLVVQADALAQHAVAQPVQAAGQVVEGRATDQRQLDGVDAAGHHVDGVEEAFDAGQHVLRVVDEGDKGLHRIEIQADVGQREIELGAEVEVLIHRERRIGMQHVVADAVAIAIPFEAAQRQRLDREEQRQIRRGIAEKFGLESVPQRAGRDAAVAIRVRRRIGEVDGGTDLDPRRAIQDIQAQGWQIDRADGRNVDRQ